MGAKSEEEKIRRLIAEYGQLCDDGRFDEWADLFTEDATFAVRGRVHSGREDLKAFIERGQPPDRRGKHVMSGPVIDLDGDTARASTDFLFVGRVGAGLAITTVGRYLDQLVRQPDRWRFAERRIVMMGDPE